MCKDKDIDIKKSKDVVPIDEFDDFMDNEFLDAIEAEEKRKKGELTQEEFEKLEFIRKSRQNVVSGDT